MVYKWDGSIDLCILSTCVCVCVCVCVYKDMAQLIVERATLINHLLPQEGVTELLSEWLQDRSELVLTSMIDLFYHYLAKAQQPQEEAISWVSHLLRTPAVAQHGHQMIKLSLSTTVEVKQCVILPEPV